MEIPRSTEYDPTWICLLEGELTLGDFDSDAVDTLPVGAKHEKPVSQWLNRPYR